MCDTLTLAVSPGQPREAELMAEATEARAGAMSCYEAREASGA